MAPQWTEELGRWVEACDRGAPCLTACDPALAGDEYRIADGILWLSPELAENLRAWMEQRGITPKDVDVDPAESN